MVAVYPFIKRFVSDTVLYKFSRDNKDRKETTPRRENTFKIAKDICLRYEISADSCFSSNCKIVICRIRYSHYMSYFAFSLISRQGPPTSSFCMS